MFFHVLRTAETEDVQRTLRYRQSKPSKFERRMWNVVDSGDGEKGETDSATIKAMPPPREES